MLTYLSEYKKINGPFLIIVPFTTIYNWERELKKWAPHLVTVILLATKEEREEIEKKYLKIRPIKFNVLVTSY